MRKSKYFLIAGLVAILQVLTAACNYASDKGPDCTNFYSGTFKIKSETDGSTVIIHRTRNRQYEIKESGDTLASKITWISPCEYQLLYSSGETDLPDTLHNYLATHPVTFKISKVEKNYYIFTATIEGSSATLTDTVFKVE